MAERCDNCRFCLREERPHLEMNYPVFFCRRYPPDRNGKMPCILPTIWCGEYQPKEKSDG